MSNNDVTRRGSDLAFGTSFFATMAVAVAPSFVTFGFLVWSRPDPKPILATLVSLVATTLAFVLGSKVWENQPESHGFSFADLMVWHWVRREWAEEKLVRNARLLGYDREGRFVGKVEISPEKQLFAAREIGAALDSKSSYTLNHSKRVEKHAREVAAALGLSEEETEQLATAAALHDIGNIRIPEHVIRKAGELTLEERSTIEGHVLLGAIMAFEAGGEAVVQGLRHHHERWDGRGYPNGLKGDAIPLFARIIGIAEAYDAMTSTRPYRQSLTQEQAIGVLREEGGTQFDSNLVEVFASTLPEPIQIVERIPALAWAQRQMRELSILFRRVGGTAVSAAASTVAIALILGTALLKPDVFSNGGNGPNARPERRMIAEGITRGDTVAERIALAAAETAATTEGVVVAEELAEADSSYVDDVEVLGERITIDGFEPGGSAGPGSDGSHGGGGGRGSSDGNDIGGPADGPESSDPDVDNPVIVDDTRGGGSSDGGSNGGSTGGGTTNPDPSTDAGHPGKGGGLDKDKGKPESPGKGIGKPDSPGNGKGKPENPGKPEGHGKADGWVNPGNGGGHGAPADKGKPETGAPADKGKPDVSPGNGSSSGAPGNSDGKSKDGWAESESNGQSDDRGNEEAPARDEGSAGAGGSDDTSPGNSSESNGNSDSPGSSGDSDSPGGSDSGGSEAGSSDGPGNSGSAGNSGSSAAPDRDRGKPGDTDI